MATAGKLQDMPPPGGFESIKITRVAPKKLVGGKTLILGHAIFTIGTIYLYSKTNRRVEREKIEYRSSINAITPLLLAERDREFLKQLRRNRDEEATLMADVEGWQVGKYYDEPIYYTLPEDTLITPIMQEYTAHVSSFERFKIRMFKYFN